MFLEKRQRYFRRYLIKLTPRAAGVPMIPVIGLDGEYSLFDAVESFRRTGEARDRQENGDEVELVSVRPRPEQKDALVLVFHRGSPKSSDPIFRKKSEGEIRLRSVSRDVNEEPAVSAHLIICARPEVSGGYAALLEEVRGLSWSVIVQLLKQALHRYEIVFEDKRGRERRSKIALDGKGIPTADLATAAKSGRLGTVTFTRPATVDLDPDLSAMVQRQNETVKFKIMLDRAGKSPLEKLRQLVNLGYDKGWDNVQVDLTLDDDRSRTVTLQREAEASEILFVRAELVNVATDLEACCNVPVWHLVDAAMKLLEGS